MIFGIGEGWGREFASDECVERVLDGFWGYIGCTTYFHDIAVDPSLGERMVCERRVCFDFVSRKYINLAR